MRWIGTLIAFCIGNMPCAVIFAIRFVIKSCKRSRKCMLLMSLSWWSWRLIQVHWCVIIILRVDVCCFFKIGSMRLMNQSSKHWKSNQPDFVRNFPTFFLLYKQRKLVPALPQIIIDVFDLEEFFYILGILTATFNNTFKFFFQIIKELIHYFLINRNSTVSNISCGSIGNLLYMPLYNRIGPFNTRQIFFEHLDCPALLIQKTFDDES